MTEDETVNAVAARLTGEFYIGQRVCCVLPHADYGPGTIVCASRASNLWGVAPDKTHPNTPGSLIWVFARQLRSI